MWNLQSKKIKDSNATEKAKKRMWFLAALVSLLGYMVYPVASIDPSLQPYVDEYLNIVNKECPKLNSFPHKVIITEVDVLPDADVGLCTMGPMFFKIEIEKKFFDANKQFRKATMFHELSHCLLGLDHVDNYKNYMYYSVIHIPDEDLNNQLIQDIQRLCKKN